MSSASIILSVVAIYVSLYAAYTGSHFYADRLERRRVYRALFVKSSHLLHIILEVANYVHKGEGTAPSQIVGIFKQISSTMRKDLEKGLSIGLEKDIIQNDHDIHILYNMINILEASEEIEEVDISKENLSMVSNDAILFGLARIVNATKSYYPKFHRHPIYETAVSVASQKEVKID